MIWVEAKLNQGRGTCVAVWPVVEHDGLCKVLREWPARKDSVYAIVDDRAHESICRLNGCDIARETDEGVAARSEDEVSG